MSVLDREDDPATATEERFEMLGTLGRGGMGCVYKALDRMTGEIVALKALLDCHSMSSVLVARFEREAEFAARIRHANVAVVHGIVEQGKRRYLKMEHVEGTTLESILQARKRLSCEVALRLIGQICAGVQAAHDAGLVHRDLKPSNILVSARDGRAVILDFGIAKSIAEDGFTQSGMLLGSLDYMSPEQLSGHPVTALSDVYSLGVLLYEMVTGICPFRIPDLTLLKRLELRQQVDDPRRHVADLPSFLVEAIGKCLDPHPESRHATPMAFWQSLAPPEEEQRKDDSAHVVLVAGSPVFLNAAPLAIVVAPECPLRDAVVLRLQRLGCRVSEFDDGRDALIYSLQHRCHVLVMSDATQGMDPWQACAVMKRYARFDSTRILVLVDDEKGALPRAREVGVTEIVTLPWNDDDFARTLRQLLD